MGTHLSGKEIALGVVSDYRDPRIPPAAVHSSALWVTSFTLGNPGRIGAGMGNGGRWKVCKVIASLTRQNMIGD